MSEPSDWTLLARYLADECTDSERAEIDQWMLSDAENQQLVQQLQTIWAAPDSAPLRINVEQMWAELVISTGIETTAASRIKKFFTPKGDNWLVSWLPNPVLRYALVAMLLISLPLLVARWGGLFTAEAPLISVHIDQGERSQVLLADGSSVILDAGSTLRHPEQFADNSREVYLDGEGYFEVVGNAEWPFIVHAGNARIGVLGTKFNVRAWEVDQRVQVAVAEGSVALNAASAGTDNGVVIHRGQGSTLPVNGLPTIPIDVVIEEELGWMNNRAVFNDVPLGEVLFQIERWYNLEFDLEVPDIANERVTVYLQQNSVKDILELVSSLIDMPYKRIGNVVRITPRNSAEHGNSN
jgi:transmembrane sensor